MTIEIEVKNEAHATEMMLYHLRIACAYFEYTNDDLGRAAIKEIRSLPSLWQDAAIAFVMRLRSAYEACDRLSVCESHSESH
jgi:hypothetical protein